MWTYSTTCLKCLVAPWTDCWENEREYSQEDETFLPY